jgi:hypothetical protein
MWGQIEIEIEIEIENLLSGLFKGVFEHFISCKSHVEWQL